MKLPFLKWLPTAAAAALVAAGIPAHAQTLARADTVRADTARPQGLVTREELWKETMRQWGIADPDPAPRHPTSRADSLAWKRARAAAARTRDRRVVISLFDRRLWLVEGTDTLLSAPAGVGMGTVKAYGRTWDFSTPRGRRTVQSRTEDPFWTPPDWHYAQVAGKYGYQLARLERGRGKVLADGKRLSVRGDTVGLVSAEGAWEAIPAERPLVFNDTLYIPPLGTVNRRIPDVLGKFRLDLGDGYLIHGTTEGSSIGFPSTHGCIRLGDADLAALFEQVKVRTPVFIY